VVVTLQQGDLRSCEVSSAWLCNRDRADDKRSRPTIDSGGSSSPSSAAPPTTSTLCAWHRPTGTWDGATDTNGEARFICA